MSISYDTFNISVTSLEVSPSAANCFGEPGRGHLRIVVRFLGGIAECRLDFQKPVPHLAFDLRPRLSEKGIMFGVTFQEFENWFTKATRVKPKAMAVFNQTVAVKDIQRLNDFIRDHMLEAHGWGEKVDRLLGHFTQLSEAHESLVRVRQQRDLLEPVARIGVEYRQQADALERAERLVRASAACFSQRMIDLFLPAVERKEGELREITARKESLAIEI